MLVYCKSCASATQYQLTPGVFVNKCEDWHKAPVKGGPGPSEVPPEQVNTCEAWHKAPVKGGPGPSEVPPEQVNKCEAWHKAPVKGGPGPSEVPPEQVNKCEAWHKAPVKGGPGPSEVPPEQVNTCEAWHKAPVKGGPGPSEVFPDQEGGRLKGYMLVYFDKKYYFLNKISFECNSFNCKCHCPGSHTNVLIMHLQMHFSKVQLFCLYIYIYWEHKH